jgi:general secretion pathway protein L
MLFQTSLGIDIQEKALCLVCLRASSRAVQLVSHGVYPLEKGIEDIGTIKGLIQEFLTENRISPTGVFLGVPRSKAILKYISLPLAVKENLRESLGYEMEKHIPFSAEDICFDFQVLSEDKNTGKLQLLLVAMKKADLAPFLDISRQLTLTFSGIEISSTALADYFLWEGGKNIRPYFSFVYFCKDGLELGFLKQGLLVYSRALSGQAHGSTTVTSTASNLKKIFETQAVPEKPVEVVFCGLDGDKPIFDALNEDIGMDIRMVDLSRIGIVSSAFLPAYGLALKGVRNVAMNINLLPPALRKKSSRVGIYLMFILASMALLGALTWGGGNVLRHHWALESLDGELQQLRSKMKKIEQVRAQKYELENRTRSLSDLRQGSAPVLDVLKELSVRIPQDAWLKQFDFSEKGIQIRGEAVSASNLIPLLEASPMFKNVAFLSAITKGQNGKENFRVGLSLY